LALGSKGADNSAQFIDRESFPQIGWHDEIRPAALFTIGHLPTHNCFQALNGHARPSKNAVGLNERRCCHNNSEVAFAVRICFEQERHIESDRKTAVPLMQGDKSFPVCAHQGMKDLFQALNGRIIVKYNLSQGRSVDLPIFNNTRKRNIDVGDRAAAARKSAVHGSVRVMNGNTKGL
jgi:hypothetical protein